MLSGRAQTTARINGRAVNVASGLPIEHATVKLDLRPGDDQPEKAAQTDPFGFFELKEIAPGDYTFKVEHPHFVGHEERAVLAPGA